MKLLFFLCILLLSSIGRSFRLSISTTKYLKPLRPGNHNDHSSGLYGYQNNFDIPWLKSFEPTKILRKISSYFQNHAKDTVMLNSSEENISMNYFSSLNNDTSSARSVFDLVNIYLDTARNLTSPDDARDLLAIFGFHPLVCILNDKSVDVSMKLSGLEGLSNLLSLHNDSVFEAASYSELLTALVGHLSENSPVIWEEKTIKCLYQLITNSDKALDDLKSRIETDKQYQRVFERIVKSNRPISTSLLGGVVQRLGGSKVTTGTVSSLSPQAQDHCNIIFSAANIDPISPLSKRGIRILSLDGGGVRGILSIALMKSLFRSIGLHPYEIFDIICGTSTGGIISTLLGSYMKSIDETEKLYDEFVYKVFAQKSNVKLLTEKARYDEQAFAEILETICGDDRLIAAKKRPCPNSFCVSSRVDCTPTTPFLWRNYHLPKNPSGVEHRYDGTCVAKTSYAIRGTTAAPTFFKPVEWRGALYCDGAMVANNPSGIALHEAKVRLTFISLLCFYSFV